MRPVVTRREREQPEAAPENGRSRLAKTVTGYCNRRMYSVPLPLAVARYRRSGAKATP
jgi:hypothetical protein